MNGSSVTAPPAAVAVTTDSCVVAAAGRFVAVDVAGGWVSGGSDGSVVTTVEPGCSIKDSGQIQD